MVRLIWCCLLLTLSGHCVGNSLKFCYEDKQLRPYYFGNGVDVPADLPGATIEHLRLLVSKVPELQLQLIRLPWKRCLQQLQQGDVDALIASYAPERELLGHYPKVGDVANAAPDAQRAFSQHQTCLVTMPDASWRWDGEKLVGIDAIVIARPLGYAPLKSAAAQHITVQESLSPAMDMELLRAGRVHAITSLCMVAGTPMEAPYLRKNQLRIIFPPLYSSTGYLVFSHRFFQQHQDQAMQLWQHLAEVRGEAIYEKYLHILAQMPK